MRRRVLQLLLGMPVWLALPACARRRTPLRVGAGPWAGYLGLRQAGLTLQASGEALRILDMPSATAVLAALRNGLLDAAALTLDETLLLLASEQPVQVVQVLDHSLGGHALVAHPSVGSLYDLPGLRVGVETEAQGAYMLTRALELSGISPERIDIMVLRADQHEAAFREGRVDALLTYDPIRTRLLALGGRELFSSRQIPGEVLDVLVVRRDALEAHAGTLGTLIQACLRACRGIQEAPQQALQQLGPRAGVEAGELARVLQGMRMVDLQGNRELLGGATGTLRGTAQRLARVMHSRALLRTELEVPASLFDARYLPAGIS